MSTVATYQPKRFFTAEEYFRLEEVASEKHEYRDGEIVSMAGGSNEHSLITANTIIALGSSLRGGPCRVYESNLRVRVRRHQAYTYPDLSVVCGKAGPELDPDDPTGRTYLTPRLIVEVLSPSTELYDRTKKFERYRAVPGFEEYVLISQESSHVETFFRRDDGGWSVDFATDIGASVRLRSINVELKLSDVYAGVTFPPPKPDPLEEEGEKDAPKN